MKSFLKGKLGDLNKSPSVKNQKKISVEIFLVAFFDSSELFTMPRWIFSLQEQY
jgi:hypothetical protein